MVTWSGQYEDMQRIAARMLGSMITAPLLSLPVLYAWILQWREGRRRCPG